jgi:hypothetical protein
MIKGAHLLDRADAQARALPATQAERALGHLALADCTSGRRRYPCGAILSGSGVDGEHARRIGARIPVGATVGSWKR